MNGASLRLGGSMTALATPFRDGQIDRSAFVRLCERQIERGTVALIICGSTGEAAALSPEDQAALVGLAVVTARGRVAVIAGCGGPSTETAVLVAGLAAAAGAAGLLCAPTPYVKPSQAGIIAHMRALAHTTDLPLIVYDVPSRVGVAIKDETLAALFERGLAIGLKDATADLGRPPRLRALCGPDFLQFSGDDATAPAYRAAGGNGCISVTANLTPSLCASLHLAWDNVDLTSFARVRDLLAPLNDALFVESNPVPLKAALELLKLGSSEVRLPLVRARGATRAKLADILAQVMIREEWLAGNPRYALAG